MNKWQRKAWRLIKKNQKILNWIKKTQDKVAKRGDKINALLKKAEEYNERTKTRT